ncbi:MAG: hypothetical protein AB7I30_07970 [Isosphaeraceae bacterium]
MRRFFSKTCILVAGLTFLVAGSAGLAGCGGEPTGEDAFSQKFEAPAGAGTEAGPMPDPGAERRAEIEKAQKEPPPKAGGKKR